MEYMNTVVLKIKDVNQTLYQDVLNSNMHVNFPLCPEGQIGLAYQKSKHIVPHTCPRKHFMSEGRSNQ